MPTCRRKRVLLTEPSQDLLEATHSDANRDVYFLAQTGEIFDTYEYVLSFLNQQQQRASHASHFRQLTEHMLPE